MATFKVIFALSFFVIMSRAEIISSIYEMESLIDTQGAVIESIELYLKEQIDNLESITRYLQLIKAEYSQAILDKENYLKNPINSYKLVKRLTVDLDFVEEMSRKNFEIKRSESVKYPDRDDFIGAVHALIRLQELYDLETSQLANGTLTGRFSENKIEYTEYVAPMTISDCEEMGTVVGHNNDYNRSISWLEEALRKQRNGEIDIYNKNEAEIMDAIIYAYFEANDVEAQESWIRQRVELLPHNVEDTLSKTRLKYFYNFSTIYHPSHSEAWKKVKVDDFIVNEPELKKLCNGDLVVPANVTKRLFCWYKSGPHPFLRLARVRTELLHRGPDVLLFHDVLTDKEIQQIQEQAKPHLMRSSVVNKTTINEDGTTSVTTVIPTYRVSQVAWLYPDESELLQQVSTRTGHFTELSMESAEPFQVANYGIGGHYDIHYDFFMMSTDEDYNRGRDIYVKNFNNRIATVLFYMSDVEQGGATAFSSFNLTMYPKKGSAIFWMNLLPNGDGDISTRHTACPVLRGNKWASNLWLHQFGQEFIRPCPAADKEKN